MRSTPKTWFRYWWHSKRILPERYGQFCRLLAARRSKVLLEFPDGTKVATVRGTYRKRPRPARP